MGHYTVMLPNGAAMPMSEEELELYKQGKWDPLAPPSPELERELEANTDAVMKEMFGDNSEKNTSQEEPERTIAQIEQEIDEIYQEIDTIEQEIQKLENIMTIGSISTKQRARYFAICKRREDLDGIIDMLQEEEEGLSL